MCYSAQVHAEYSKFRREVGAEMDLDSYVRLFWGNEGRIRTGAAGLPLRRIALALIESAA